MSGDFNHYLKQRGLEQSTREKYVDLLADSPSPDELIRSVHAIASMDTPVGTLLPARAAAKHYLVGIVGYPEESVQDLLPEARGRASRMRPALSPEQLALYHAAVEQLRREPVRTILALLPLTGMQIGEICSRRVDDVFDTPEGLFFRFERRGQKVQIPVPRRLLSNYVARHDPKEWLFVTGPDAKQRHGRDEAPISTDTVRKYTQAIAKRYPVLQGLSPQRLRTTFIRTALASGVPEEDLRLRLGIQHISTLRRYTRTQ